MWGDRRLGPKLQLGKLGVHGSPALGIKKQSKCELFSRKVSIVYIYKAGAESESESYVMGFCHKWIIQL